MRNTFISLIAAIVLLGGCARQGHGADVLGPSTGSSVIYATTECTAPNSDGVSCNKKTCKADKVSDCKEFASACLDSGHYYQGTNAGGACSRVL